MENLFDRILDRESALAFAAQQNVHNPNANIVGVYQEVSVDALAMIPIIGLESEVVRFVGYTQSGQRVEAYYAGVSVSVGESLGGAANLGGGAFSFTGNPSSLFGPSLGTQLSAGVTSGLSIGTDGSILGSRLITNS